MTKNSYITKQCRDMAHNGNAQAMIYILAYYDKYIKAMALNAVKSAFANRKGDYEVYTEDLIQEIKVKIIMNSHKFKD